MTPSALLEVAEEHRLETRATELSTAQGTPVTLPPVAGPNVLA